MENAAIRNSFASSIYAKGVAEEKDLLLKKVIPSDIASMHINGDIHIHDCESFGKIYNCCTPDLYPYLKRKCENLSGLELMISVFEQIRLLITNLANYQSGGIGFGNIDLDIQHIFTEKELPQTTDNIRILNLLVEQFINWINLTRTRFCRETYYLTLNFGLATGFWGRAVSKAVLQSYMNSPMSYTKPNIVFKWNLEINGFVTSQNYDLYQIALTCAAKRMVPTFLLTNSLPNQLCPPEELNIMGCRTRVFDNLNGESGTIGRGNIGCISINLPRLAFLSDSLSSFLEQLKSRMEICSKLFNFRNDLFIQNKDAYLTYVLDENIWRNINSGVDILQNGTYAIGFIGLSEVTKLLINESTDSSAKARNIALEIVQYMRKYTDQLRDETNMNYSLLATPGEMISGRFCQKDAQLFHHPIFEKGFYTNSFHIDVSVGMPLLSKIEHEAPFHLLCNGGCISYIEFDAAPLGNTLALQDALFYAQKQGMSYIGFNYPLDICRNCNYNGTFDCCPQCGSKDIKRIRRVSGYLEDAQYFTDGKKAEIMHRKYNASTKFIL